jgi:hypothetical protein
MSPDGRRGPSNSGRICLVSPTATTARRFVTALARHLPGAELSPYSLDRFLSDRRAPARIVICPAGRDVRDDLVFLEDVRRRALWPGPGSELAGAIAGLRGEHDAPETGAAPRRAARGRTTALLLEGDVNRTRAQRAVESGAPRHWIVERVQSVRIPAAGVAELRRLGIRLSALDPIEVVALAASPALASAPSRWTPRLPAGVPVWTTSPPRVVGPEPLR